ncbi:DNA-binding protein, H-NS family [Rubellimicrobium mesophilum DSM 19309]|uniref:DNA-binding protein, H-NS family n=1 Tax=Rubellimicrobium mesophilum DSM 19309 TaxID=442562 RepID=A0A017HLA2_9RHOB|nr:H-NS histone family protein [Rubellimicrobium mesophilum]EYD74953.1 DNA-binding protein, H-NS family [Rubellimicrobium mesophilum DSM 19309]
MDLESMSRDELMKLRASLDKAISTAGERDRRNALKAAEDAVRQHGFTLAEIADMAPKGGRGMRHAKSSGAAQYRNPDNLEQTWSGRGRRPRWIHEAEAAGRSLEELRVG